MGFDVFGKAPTAREGEYFRRNIWGWPHLAYLVETLCPDEAAACQHWYSNDGDGLDAAGAAALAAKLEERRDGGDVAAHCAQLDALTAAVPRDACPICGGSGEDSDPVEDAPELEPGEMLVIDLTLPARPRRPNGKPCVTCHGVGTIEPLERWGRCTPNDVDQFIAFVKASGGFEIW